MPFSGGVYTPPSLPGSWSPAIQGQAATSDDWNTLLTDLSTALSTTITRNGQSTITADLPMANHKLTGLSAGAANGDSVRYEQVIPLLTARGYLAGLGTSNNVSTPNTKVDVAAGICTDSTNALVMSAAAGTINCATTGANALDTGTLANSTWYHTFVIGKTDYTTALLASTSPSSPTMPTGYTLLRRIGSFKTDGSAHILPFVQNGDLFANTTPVNDISASNPGTAAVTRTLASVPTGVKVQAWVQGIVANTSVGNNVAVYLSDLATTNMDPASTSPYCFDFATAPGSAGGVVAAGVKAVYTNTSAQIRSRLSFSDGGVGLVINTLGWIDRRGKDA